MNSTFQDPELHFIWMEVSNLRQSVDFYRDSLGFPVQEQGDSGDFAIVHLANTKLYLAPGMPRGMGMYIAISVVDIDAMHHRLRLKGIAAAAPLDEGWARYINIIDPNGYRLLLMQPASPS